MNKNIRSYLSLVLSQCIRIPISILSFALLARIMGPDGIGLWTMVVAVATFLHSIFLNWTQASNVRFGREEWQTNGTLLETWSNRWPLLIAGFLISIIVFLWNPFNFIYRLFKIPITYWSLVFIYLLGLWLMAESQSILQITGKMNKLAIAQTLLPFLLLIYYVITFMGLGYSDPINIIKIIILFTVLFWGNFWLKEFLKTKTKFNYPNILNLMKFIKYGWSLIPAFLVGYFSDWGDQLLIQHYFTNQEVGMFQTAYQVILSVIGLSFPLTTVLLPTLVSLNLNDSTISKKYLEQFVPAIFVIWGILNIPLITILPDLYLLVVGDKFFRALFPLSIMTLAIPCACISSLCTVLFSIQNRLPRTFIYALIMTSVNIIISIILLPSLGLIGSAVGTSISYILIQSLYLWDQSRFLNTKNYKTWIVFLYLLIFAFMQVFFVYSMRSRIIIGMISLLLYFLMVRLFNIIQANVIKQLFGGLFERIGDILITVLVRGRLED